MDMVALRYAVQVNGMDAIALTKLDVLTGMKEILVAESYEIDGVSTDRFSGAAHRLVQATPVYRALPGWQEDLSSCRRFDELPQAAQDYVTYLEEATGIPVVLIGVGPAREATILRGL
jgi:adenylosuccinate synthase